MGYPGGKGGDGVFQKLISLMPPHEVYIEPFAGGAALMRAKRPAAVNIAVDLSQSCIERLQLDLVGSADLARRQRRPPAPELARRAASASIGGNGERRRLDRASSPAASGSSLGGNGAVRSPEFRFIQGDGIEFLESYPFAGQELVYCDPPYLMSTRSGRKLYEHEMDEISHARLLRVIRELPCMVMISGYSSVLYAKTLKDWNVASFTAVTRGGTERAEWVWYNFPRPVELHDYRYLGSDFRERERIKRKTRRWTERLKRMPTLERQALLSAIAGIADSSE
jgi:DNA adenine methylase